MKFFILWQPLFRLIFPLFTIPPQTLSSHLLMKVQTHTAEKQIFDDISYEGRIPFLFKWTSSSPIYRLWVLISPYKHHCHSAHVFIAARISLSTPLECFQPLPSQRNRQRKSSIVSIPNHKSSIYLRIYIYIELFISKEIFPKTTMKILFPLFPSLFQRRRAITINL